MKRLLVLLSAALVALAGVVGMAGVSSAAFGATKPALSIAVSPMAATANSTGNALTFKVTASSSVSGQLSLVVPAGWTAPQASNPALPGYVAVQKLTCASAGPSPTSITGSGPWTMSINFSCATNKSFSLSYSNVTAPAATGSYQFTSSVGGQPLSAQPAVKVNPAPVHLSVTGLPGATTAGTAASFTVSALNSNNNVVTGYTGTVHFTSTDGQAVLPANYTFTAADAGKHTFTSGVTFKTAGSQTLTATDTSNSSITGTSSAVTVAAPPAATHFLVTAQFASATAGTADMFTVKALDSSGNTVTGYTGTVHFTSTDASASLPADATLTNGTGTFSATFKTVGTQELTATDKSNSSITGTSQAVTVAAGVVTQFFIQSGPILKHEPFVTTGTTNSFTVTAEDASGNVVPGYTGTVAFTSSDLRAGLPADYTFTAADAGVHTFTPGVTFITAGQQTLTVTDASNSSVTGSLGFLVSAGPATQFAVSAPSAATAGTAFSFTVTAEDQFGNTVTGYAGTVDFSSSDGSATLPADTTLTNGTGTFSATLQTAGTQTLTATDSVTPSVTGSQSVTVAAGAVTQFSVQSGPILKHEPFVTAGAATSFTVTAEDASGNVVPGYTGTVAFTSSDLRAVLPADYTFTTADGGTHTFTPGVTFLTAGQQTLTVTDAANSSVTGSLGFGVSAGPATVLVVSGLANPSVAGAAQSVTVTAQDAYGNMAAGYAGTVAFTSGDTNATLPVNYTFTAADGGTHTFTPGVTFDTAGSQTLTATDTSDSSITGSQTVTVAVPVTSFAIAGLPGSATAETANTFTVTALDANNQVVPGYTGTVHFTSSDGQAGLPANYTFTAADAGQHKFTAGVTFNTVGSQTVTATDTADSSVTGTSAPVTVTAAPATHFAITGLPGASPAGTADTFTVTALDANNQVVPGYTGTVTFSSSDPQAGLPGQYTFTANDAGVHTFSPGVTFNTAGEQAVIATDAGNSIGGTSAPVTVTAPPVTHFEITGLPAASPVGALNTFTVTALDANNQVATGYTGTVHFTSSDGQAFLPSDYTFTANDAGVHTFTPGVAFRAPGPQTLTVTDTPNSSITGSASVSVGSCSNGPLTIHADGLGQNFTDCVQLDIYNQTQATEAALAWLGPAANSPAAVQVVACPDGNNEVVTTMIPGPGGQFASWDFTGSNAGYVAEGPPGQCPSGGTKWG